MRRLYLAAATAAALAASLLSGPAAFSAPSGSHPLEVYVGHLTAAQLTKLPAAVGVDLHDTPMTKGPKGRTTVELALTGVQAAKLASEGVKLTVKKVDGDPASARLDSQATNSAKIFRSYSEPGGIRDELVKAAEDHPGIAKLVPVGKSLKGQTMYAVKVTKNARAVPDGDRPAVLYMGTQHAREWITPEMVRRLMQDILAGYGHDAAITNLVKTTELWFLPVLNPDGYDFTFTEDNRLWRKNLRDVNGDGAITAGDGVDLNRNYPTRWGYDNEGSSDSPSNDTYRGATPASEPETRALDNLAKRIDFTYAINYHSAAQLLLYGVGWQVSTPTPDDIVYESLAGDDEHPGVPGYDPDISAELYTTNGETTEHLQHAYGTLAFTPEMSTCQTASASDPDDAWEPEDCVSSFMFPEDEKLIAAEYAKNVPFALNVAKAAHHPDNPDGVGGATPDLAVDDFAVSYGESSQQVAVTARRSLRKKTLHYRINGGAAKSAAVREWDGGERYGDTNNVYYAEYRGLIRGQQAGDTVEVWFTGNNPGTGPVSSEHFEYTVASDTGSEVLILAAEDVTGASPDQDGDGAKYASFYESALRTAGYSSDVYDMDRRQRRSPHHLGVLSHYKAVVWETGDDVIPREVGQPGGTTTKSTLDTELAVRDYLNEGGKLLMTGQYNGFAAGANGAYYYNPYAPPQCTTPGEDPCLPLFNDFQQYYLGAYTYVSDGGTGDDGAFPVKGTGGEFDGFDGALGGGDGADNQGHTASYLTTSSFLPPADFPQFASSAPISWVRPGGAPYDPRTGTYYLSSGQADKSYKRVTRTIDLTGASSGKLEFYSSHDIETDWDYQFVEAHTVGADDWTTLPDANGHTQRGTGGSCESGWAEQIHPHMAHYQGADCSATGTTGDWHAATGNSNGWKKWSIDLSAYAGKQVEVSISYASDWSSQGIGSFLDDAAVIVDGETVTETSFESDLGGWTVTGPPTGSPQNATDWTRSVKAFEEGAGVVTSDSVWVGFGIEGFSTADSRAEFVKRSMRHLLG